MRDSERNSENSHVALQAALGRNPRTWLVTGAAGFIGSNLVEELLRLGQSVVGLDNFSTGHRRNLEEVRLLVSPEHWDAFRFIEGDIRKRDDCAQACAGVHYVLHQAALGSVPRSLEHPLRSHENNVDGFVNMLTAARDAKVERFVYASSSSVYGDHPKLPKEEAQIGRPLSPYAATKLIGEIYAGVFDRCYALQTVGLRYFNVFGPRQDPNGAYAAVIPKWFAALFRGEELIINGDGETSRDFCYVANTVQANLLAATTERKNVSTPVYNIACGESATLLDLHVRMCALVTEHAPGIALRPLSFRPERRGDVRHSKASIEFARRDLGYSPTHQLADGLRITSKLFARLTPGGRPGS